MKWNILDNTGNVLQTVTADSVTEAVAKSDYTYPSVVARLVQWDYINRQGNRVTVKRSTLPTTEGWLDVTVEALKPSSLRALSAQNKAARVAALKAGL